MVIKNQGLSAMKLRLLAAGAAFVLYSLYITSCHAQANQNPTDMAKTFLDYTKAVIDDEGNYLAFIKEIAAASVAIGGALLAFFSFKSKSDIRQEVSSRVSKDIDLEITKALGILKLDMEKRIGKFIDENFARYAEDLRQRRDFIDKALIDIAAEVDRVRNPREQGSSSESLQADDILRRFRILWVDDMPKNNADLVELFESLGAIIDRSLNTESALDELARKNYDLIISDMARPESQTAGLDLLKIVKDKGITTPLVLFCGARNLRNHGQQAVEAGSYAVTSTFPGIIRAVNQVARHRPPLGVIAD